MFSQIVLGLTVCVSAIALAITIGIILKSLTEKGEKVKKTTKGI